MTEPVIATDWRGNTYTEGSTVLYPRQSGRCVEMREATVLQITDKEEGYYVFDRDAGQRVLHTRTVRAVRLMPTRSSRFDRSWTEHKATTIHNVENITAVTQ
ncbi:hypothetical protein ACXJJ3_32870 [Kribbella sp. WER1]